MSLLSWLLVTLAGLSLAAMVVSVIVAQRATREARATIFPIVREEETTRARRARIMSSLTGVIAAILAGAFFLSGQLPSSTILPVRIPAGLIAAAESPVPQTEPPPAPTATSVPPASAQPLASSPQPQDTAAPPPTSAAEGPSATPIPLPPTLTSTPAPSATSTSPPPSPTATRPPATAPAGTQLGPIAFTTQISDGRTPIGSTDVFSDTVDRVYATFPYDGMQNGVNWTHVWYFNGVEFSRSEENWRWGSSDSSFVFINPVGAGEYRLELYVNDDLLASAEFMVQGLAAIGGPTANTPVPSSPEGTETPGSP